MDYLAPSFLSQDIQDVMSQPDIGIPIVSNVSNGQNSTLVWSPTPAVRPPPVLGVVPTIMNTVSSPDPLQWFLGACLVWGVYSA